MIINTIEQLENFVLHNDLTSTEIKDLLSASVGCYVSDEQTSNKILLMRKVKDYLKKYPENDFMKRPLFID